MRRRTKSLKASVHHSPPPCRSTGKAAWIASTTFLLLVAPLIVEMDREQQMVEFENQSLGALTGK